MMKKKKKKTGRINQSYSFLWFLACLYFSRFGKHSCCSMFSLLLYLFRSSVGLIFLSHFFSFSLFSSLIFLLPLPLSSSWPVTFLSMSSRSSRAFLRSRVLVWLGRLWNTAQCNAVMPSLSRILMWSFFCTFNNSTMALQAHKTERKKN